MSSYALSQALNHSAAKGATLAALLVLADMADHDGFAWVDMDNLAEVARVSRPTLNSSLQKLESIGDLSYVRNKNHLIIKITSVESQFGNDKYNEVVNGQKPNRKAVPPDPLPKISSDEDIYQGSEEANKSFKSHARARDFAAAVHQAIHSTGKKMPYMTPTAINEARMLLDVDKRDPDEALDLLRWALNHRFWGSHVLSVAKLRSKYDAVKHQRQGGSQGGVNSLWS